MCEQKTESIDYLVFCCTILTLIEYKERPYKRGHYIHWKVDKYYGILNCEKWCQYQPEPLTEANGTTVLSDFAIQTDRKIKSNYLDTVIKGYRKHAF